ncbi:hypothetical protein CNMCM8060_003286 [Aspergillus lentulus]|nr:hypothetical protein CNMCM8060_003286 [Aspergillus lentulus]
MTLSRPNIRALPRQFLIIHRNSSTNTSATQDNTKRQPKKAPCDFARNYDTRVNGLSSHFVWTNQSKESRALEVKTPGDHRILMRLVSRTDVLVQNLASGASARLGLSFADLSEKHPSLIVCNISGYRPDGPYRAKKAYDILIQSEARLLSVTGTATEPAKVGISIADICRGCYTYSIILAEHRGCNIDISMLESMVEWMGFPMHYTHGDQPGQAPASASQAAIYPSGSGAKIISSVGISPLLLALDGILHEARVYRKRNLNKRLEYVFMAFVHVVVATGVAIVGTGAGGLAGKNPKASDQTNLDVGMASLEASWAILTIWTLWTLKDCSEKTISGVKEGKMVDLTLTREDSASQCAIGSANALNASSSTACS